MNINIYTYTALIGAFFSYYPVQTKMPPNFRMMHTPGSASPKNGLENVHASGSGQFSQSEIKEALKTIQRPTIIVDLRHESHPVHIKQGPTWCVKAQSASTGVCLGAGSPATVVRHSAIPVVDGGLPKDGQIDQFLALLDKIKSTNIWLHIHCLAGRGRTTTFLILYDIYVNAPKVGLADIIQRQSKLGGYSMNRGNSSRKKLLSRFYTYMTMRRKGSFNGSWSQWSKNH